MKKKILVTGGAGFIGSNFIYLLLEERQEWKVVCVDSLTYAANFHTLNKALENPNLVFYKEGGHQYNFMRYKEKYIIATDSKEYNSYMICRIIHKSLCLLKLFLF